MVEQPQQGQQLSQTTPPPASQLPQPNATTGQPDGHIDLGSQQFVLAQQSVEDTTPTAIETKVGKTKLNAILSILNECDDYTQFSQQLDNLTLPDGGLVDDLAEQTTDAFVKGLDGYQNTQGENQL